MPGLAFAGGIGVSQINIFRTLVRGFREFRDEVPEIFRTNSFWFWNQLIISVRESGRVYMRCRVYKLWNAYTFMLFHNKVAIQTEEHYISTNNLTTLHWAVIYRVLTKLTSHIKQ
jgi:hypothetical protein